MYSLSLPGSRDLLISTRPRVVGVSPPQHSTIGCTRWNFSRTGTTESFALSWLDADEPGEVNPIQRESSQLLRKAFAALRAEGIRRSDIASALSLYPTDLDSLVFGLVMSALDGGGDGAADGGTTPALSVV